MLSVQTILIVSRLLLNLILISQTVNCYPYQQGNENHLIASMYSNFETQQHEVYKHKHGAERFEHYPKLHILINNFKRNSFSNQDNSFKLRNSYNEEELGRSGDTTDANPKDDLHRYFIFPSKTKEQMKPVTPKRIVKRSCQRKTNTENANETSTVVINKTRVEPSDTDRSRRCPYDYDKKYCRLHDGIIRCGYDKNKETCISGSVPLENGCVIIKGVKACGYSGAYLEEKTLKPHSDYGCVIHNQRILCGYQRGDYFLDLKPWETHSDILH